jgi:hypothetical protein
MSVQRQPDDEGQDSMMGMMLAMMAMCLGVVTFAVLLPSLGLVGGLGVAIALGAVMLIGHRLFMHPGGHRQ